MRGLVQHLEKVLARPGVLSASVAEGYPYADVAEMGMAFLAIADGDAALAQETARALAHHAWEHRNEMRGAPTAPAAAMQSAADAPRGPVVLLDVGDNIGGGAPADSTVLLALAQQMRVRGFLQTLYDPETVKHAIAAGVGATSTFQVGAKTDRIHGDPVLVRGRVRLISDGQFEEPKPTHGGRRFFDAGPTVVLETDADHTVVLTSRRIGNTSLQQMYALGIRPEAKRVVVAKGVVSPRAAYGPIAAELITVDTPGVTSANLSRFEYRHRRRPLFPFEEDATYEPGP
jgi:microcystin degradation protein MlrC